MNKNGNGLISKKEPALISKKYNEMSHNWKNKKLDSLTFDVIS